MDFLQSNRERFAQLLRWREFIANVISIPRLSEFTKNELKSLYKDIEREIEMLVTKNKGVML